jgi:DNA-binding transcriptional LysR family regulator
MTDRLRREVPSLGRLAVFQAAVRTGGFTRAAEHLGITQAAVSRQIRGLEHDLDAALFVRANRRVELTPAGRILAKAVEEAFSTIGEAVATVRKASGPEVLTIGATLAFSHFWLLPRLPAFRSRHPSIPIRVVTEDTPSEASLSGLDVLLRYGAPPRGAEAVASVGETVFPVASPGFAAGLGTDLSLSRLVDLPLIDSDVAEPSWLSWRRWFQSAGSERTPKAGALRFSHYSDAVYAAIAGEGLALGWALLLERPLSDGRLVKVGSVAVTPPERYHVLLPNRRAKRDAVRAFAEWLEACLQTER